MLQALGAQSPYTCLARCYRSMHGKRRKFQDLNFGGRLGNRKWQRNVDLNASNSSRGGSAFGVEA